MKIAWRARPRAGRTRKELSRRSKLLAVGRHVTEHGEAQDYQLRGQQEGQPAWYALGSRKQLERWKAEMLRRSTRGILNRLTSTKKERLAKHLGASTTASIV
jgi:hypothetical protein